MYNWVTRWFGFRALEMPQVHQIVQAQKVSAKTLSTRVRDWAATSVRGLLQKVPAQTRSDPASEKRVPQIEQAQSNILNKQTGPICHLTSSRHIEKEDSNCKVIQVSEFAVLFVPSKSPNSTIWSRTLGGYTTWTLRDKPGPQKCGYFGRLKLKLHFFAKIAELKNAPSLAIFCWGPRP